MATFDDAQNIYRAQGPEGFREWLTKLPEENRKELAHDIYVILEPTLKQVGEALFSFGQVFQQYVSQTYDALQNTFRVFDTFLTNTDLMQRLERKARHRRRYERMMSRIRPKS